MSTTELKSKVFNELEFADDFLLEEWNYTTVSNSGGHQTILHTPNLKYICIDASEQIMIQTILDQSGLSANIEIDCEDFTTSFTENPIADLKIYPNPAFGEFRTQLAGNNKVSVFSSDRGIILDELMNNELKISNLTSVVILYISTLLKIVKHSYQKSLFNINFKY